MTSLRYIVCLAVSVITVLVFTNWSGSVEEWGFYGHREINKHAIFTCPPPLVAFYKRHIDYITEHAVDPDKRRHASKFESIKHYIDIDHWDVFPFRSVPRTYSEAIYKYGKFRMHHEDGSETVILPEMLEYRADSLELILSKDSLYSIYYNFLFPKRYAESMSISFENQEPLVEGLTSIEFVDSFSQYGILPFALLEIHQRLVSAFEREDQNSILRLSADYGHYIADACVPLHTTENYDGQLTGQDGIHAFWESRLPELFAEEDYDLFVGKAEYVQDINSFIWEIILDSHSNLDRVLGEELKLRSLFDVNLQYCYDERNGLTVRTQCPEYAKAYQSALGGMVEERFRTAIKATGDLWYTAWVQAGRPNLSIANLEFEQVAFDTIRHAGKIIGRPH